MDPVRKKGRSSPFSDVTNVPSTGIWISCISLSLAILMLCIVHFAYYIFCYLLVEGSKERKRQRERACFASLSAEQRDERNRRQRELYRKRKAMEKENEAPLQQVNDHQGGTVDSFHDGLPTIVPKDGNVWLFSFVGASFQSIPEQAHNVIPPSTSIDFAGNTNLAIRVSCKHTQCCRNVCVFGRLRLD